MKTSTVLLAGAIAFDLGTMIVPGHAGEFGIFKFHAPPTESVSFNFAKIDLKFTPAVCASKGGKVVQHDGVQQCQLPKTPTPGHN